MFVSSESARSGGSFSARKMATLEEWPLVSRKLQTADDRISRTWIPSGYVKIAIENGHL